MKVFTPTTAARDRTPAMSCAGLAAPGYENNNFSEKPCFFLLHCINIQKIKKTRFLELILKKNRTLLGVRFLCSDFSLKALKHYSVADSGRIMHETS